MGDDNKLWEAVLDLAVREIKLQDEYTSWKMPRSDNRMKSMLIEKDALRMENEALHKKVIVHARRTRYHEEDRRFCTHCRVNLSSEDSELTRYLILFLTY